ncbi:hypothetical protein [Streptomyces sp. 2-1]|uniref:hypothetical protein n=1 Tax=Streptomyces sp. 2-1 TaxID=412710 RepID=UPI003AFA582A|nr:hypothetical protein [Streptomyces phaeochromogenes]
MTDLELLLLASPASLLAGGAIPLRRPGAGCLCGSTRGLKGAADSRVWNAQPVVPQFNCLDYQKTANSVIMLSAAAAVTEGCSAFKPPLAPHEHSVLVR